MTREYYLAHRNKICAARRVHRLTPQGQIADQRYKNSSKGRATHRAVTLRLTYGLTVAEWDQLFAAQNGRCALCQQPAAHFAQRLHVDHDHSTHLIRGLLCWGCNRLLPCRKDLIGLFQKAIIYLKTPPAVHVLGERFTPKKKRK